MSEQMSDSWSAEEIMERIRARVRLRKQAGNGQGVAVPVAPTPVSQEKPAATLSLYDLSEMRNNAMANNVLLEQVGKINPRRPGLHNDLIQLLKKALRRASMWYTRPLHEFHGSVTRTLKEAVRALENLEENVTAMSTRVDSLADSKNRLV